MEATNMLATQLTASAASAYFIQLLQKWEKTPWITEHTKGITAMFRVALSGVAALGVSWAWAGTDSGGHTLTLMIPSVLDLAHGVWHWFGQYAITHGFGGVLKAADLASPAGEGK